MFKKLSLIVAIVMLMTLTTIAEVPQLINYQGQLNDASGSPVPDGSYLIRFIIYNSAVGGLSFWNSGFQTVIITGGVFSIDLGSSPMPVLPHNLFNDSSRYLGITVAADPEITPRTRLTSTPFTYQALRADTAGNSILLDGEPLSNIPLKDANNTFTGSTNYFNGELRLRDYLHMYRGGLSRWRFHDGTAGEGLVIRQIYNDANVNSSTNRFEIEDDGDIAIGLTDADVKLHVFSDTDAVCFQSDYDGPNSTILKAEYTGPNTSNYDVTAVHGIANQNIFSEYGIGGKFEGGYQGVIGNGYNVGVRGVGMDDNGHSIGVYGRTVVNNFSDAIGVKGDAYVTGDAYGYGIYGYVSGTTTGNKYAGYFSGNAHVTGTLSKGGGSFKIDHPLDPENKYLQHSFVESPDMMNVYNGNIILDANGQAVITMPEYFDALNSDFRYQLTPIGTPGPNLYIASEISVNIFTIAGGEPNSKVSWQVTGIRQDNWANENRIKVEVTKKVNEKGKYIHPEVFGRTIEESVDYENLIDKGEKEVHEIK